MTKRLLLLVAFLLVPGVASAQTTWSISPPSGETIINGLQYPTVDGTNGQAIVTDGAGHLSLQTIVGSGTVTTTGSPANGNLAQFSGATSITNGDLSGAVTTSGTLATTLAANAVGTTNIAANAVTLAKLATQSDKTLLANISGGAAVPTAATLSAILDNILGSAQGDIIYRGASTWTVLAPGTNGQFLQTQGAAANVQWATPGGAGTVTTTGSPANGNLTQFSGATSITNGDLSGDVTTSGTLATTIGANKVTLAKLATQANLTVLANISGGAAVPAADTLTAIIDATIGATQGDVLYRNATIWTVLAPGTSGQVLTTQGVAANPVWGNVGVGTVTHTAGALALNQLVIGNASADLKTLGTLGTTTTVLHGNAAGAPTFSAVSLTTDVTGNLPVTNLNGGTGASSTTVWCGNGTWCTPPGAGAVTGIGGGQQVTFWTAPTVVSGDAAFTWDNTNKVLTTQILQMTGKLALYNNAVPLNGQLLIGSTGGGTWNAATLTAGAGITVTNGAGSVTIASTAGVPASPTGSEQFNNAGAFGGESAVLHAAAFGFATAASGATNRTALQNAHNALPTTGGTIICSGGAYAITGTVTITKSVTWSGPCALTESTGSATIFAVQTVSLNVFDGLYLTNAANGTAISLDGVLGAAAWNSGTSYSPGDMVVSGGVPYTAAFANTNKVPPSSTACGSSQACWSVNSNGGTIVKNMTFVGGDYGVRTIRASQWFIGPGNSFFGQTNSSIFVTNTGNQDGGDSTIFSNFILAAASANGITWEGSGGTRIENNKVFAASSASPCAASIVIQPAADTNTQAVQVVGNNLSNCNYGLLTQVVGGGVLQRLLVSDNIIDGVLNPVNLSNSNVLEIIVSNNIMATGAAQTLINVAHASDVTVSENQLKGFGVPNTFGIDIAATTARVMVGPNNFSQLTSAVRDSGTNTIYTGGGTVFAFSTLPGTAQVGSNVYCNDCRGSQDIGYLAGACVATGAHTGAKATFQGSSWQC